MVDYKDTTGTGHLNHYILLLLLSVSWCECTDSYFVFNPPNITRLLTGDTTSVLVNTSRWPLDVTNIYSDDPHIAKVTNITIVNLTTYSVEVKGIFLGRTHLNFPYRLYNNTDEGWTNVTPGGGGNITPPSDTSDIYQVAVIRKTSWLDTMFIVAVGLVVVMANVAMGCKIDLNVVKEVLRRPFAPAIGFCCQFIIMPLVAYGVARILKLEGGQALGYFASGCSPGGGASNMYTYILGGDLSLSVTMTLISTLASFGMIPLWLYTLGKYFIDEKTKISIPFQNILISLAGIVIPVGIGVIIQRRKPDWSKQLVKCLKPLFIGLIVFLFTAGMWINAYLFGLFTTKLVLAGCLLPYFGFILSGIAATLCRQPVNRIVTIIIETGIQNTGIPILLMKFSLPQPEADLSVISPVLVAMFTPFPLWIALAIKEIHKRCCKNKDNRTDTFRIVSTDSDDEASVSPVMSDVTDVISDNNELDYTFNVNNREMKDVSSIAC